MPKIRFISFYVKNKLTYLIAILLLFITFKYSIAYKSSYIELVNIFIYLFFPALFPTIFLTNLISCSFSFDKIKNIFILKVITISLCLIGGSLTTINIAKKIKFKCLKDKELFLINLSGGSLSYYFLVFSFYNQFKPWLLTAIIFLAKLIISLIILNDFSFIPSINNRNYIFESLNTSFNSLYNMLKSLALITLIIPFFKLISNQYLSNVILGFIEFTRAGLRLAQIGNILSLFLLVFIVDFNGLTTLIQIKMSHSNVRQYLYIIYKLPLSLFISSLLIIFAL